MKHWHGNDDIQCIVQLSWSERVNQRTVLRTLILPGMEREIVSLPKSKSLAASHAFFRLLCCVTTPNRACAPAACGPRVVGDFYRFAGFFFGASAIVH